MFHAHSIQLYSGTNVPEIWTKKSQHTKLGFQIIPPLPNHLVQLQFTLLQEDKNVVQSIEVPLTTTPPLVYINKSTNFADVTVKVNLLSSHNHNCKFLLHVEGKTESGIEINPCTIGPFFSVSVLSKTSSTSKKRRVAEALHTSLESSPQSYIDKLKHIKLLMERVIEHIEASILQEEDGDLPPPPIRDGRLQDEDV